MDTICADSLVPVIKDTLLRMNLNLNQCHGQCYDGASNMAGPHSGIATQIATLEPCAVYTHCYGHALILAVGDTVQQCKLLRDTLDTCSEISKLLKYSPQQDTVFEKLKVDLAPDVPGFRTLCPTRWIVKAATMESVIENYNVFQQLWDDDKDVAMDSEVQMQLFDFLFGLLLGETILKHTDNLSRTLQSQSISATEGQHIAELTCKTMESFGAFWKRALQHQSTFNVSAPVLLRKRKCHLDMKLE